MSLIIKMMMIKKHQGVRSLISLSQGKKSFHFFFNFTFSILQKKKNSNTTQAPTQTKKSHSQTHTHSSIIKMIDQVLLSI